MSVNHLTIYEFDTVCAADAGSPSPGGPRPIPLQVYQWLELQCLRSSADGESTWLRLGQRSGRRVVQVTSFVGVIRAPNGFQIEVLPKIGKTSSGEAGDVKARQLLLDMLRCLEGFRHVQTDSARIAATRMPLLEVFMAQFLRAVDHVVKRGLRSDYSPKQDNLFALRGKLLVAAHLRQNLHRADRFFTEHDEFSTDRPENRLLHAALRRVLTMTSSQANQRLARELAFVFADVPLPAQPRLDFQRIRRDRATSHYADALAWARIILDEESPLTGAGGHRAPSLLFPMEAVFEAFVAKHLAGQLGPHSTLKTQAQRHHLVCHREQHWFRLKPDLLICIHGEDRVVLDTKWKLLDSLKANGTDKYGLSQSDFYQLHAYGQAYLDGHGDVVLIYPKTSTFDGPLKVFEFPKSAGLRLWVLPFCLENRRLIIPAEGPLIEAVTA